MLLPLTFWLLYFPTSFLGNLFLVHHLFLCLKRKYGLKFRTWRYSLQCNIFMIICLICSFLFIIYNWESFETFYFLGGPVSAIVCIYMKEKQKFTDADINNCQRDTESIGAFWAHQAYDAHYNIALNNIQDRISKFEKDRSVKFLVNKLILVVPLSCDVRGILTNKDENIKFIDDLEPIEYDEYSNYNRTVKNPAYEIALNKPVYIAAEYPNTLNSLWKSRNDLGMEKFKYHRDCFIKTMKSLVKDSPCVVVEYDDTVPNPETLSSFLLSTFREKENVYLPME